MQVMKIQRGQSSGSVFGRVVWNVASRAFTNTVASERYCVQLYCASRGRARRRGRKENAPRPDRVERKSEAQDLEADRANSVENSSPAALGTKHQGTKRQDTNPLGSNCICEDPSRNILSHIAKYRPSRLPPLYFHHLYRMPSGVLLEIQP